MLIAIPSKGRPDCKTPTILPAATLYVPANEAGAYRQCHPRVEVVAVPQQIRGITPTRNWILDHTPERWVVMIDDDVKVCGWVLFLGDRTRHRKLAADEWYAEFFRLFELTEDLGYRIWGINSNGASRSVHPFRPMIWQTYVTASCMGLINGEQAGKPAVRFDERFTVKEDYELCLRCIQEDGGIIGARQLFWHNSHWHDDGGCREYRTQQVERDAIRLLQSLYPGRVRQITRGGCDFSIELSF